MLRRHLYAIPLIVSVATACAAAALAQSAYPGEKAVTLIVPFPAGGSTDTIARSLAPKLQEKLGGTFIVDSRPGATGTIAAGLVRRAPADGHTLFVSSLGLFVVAPHLLKHVPHDATKDFDLLTVAVRAPNVLVVAAASPLKSVPDPRAKLKAEPGKVAFASSGNGSSDHLTAELFWQQTGTDRVHVPYKDGAPAVNDLLGGQVDASFRNIDMVIQDIASGKLRTLAIAGDLRSTLLPQVPTLAEAGAKGVDVCSGRAVAAPKGMPVDVKDKLYGALADALNDPQLKPKLTRQGFEIVASTPEQFARFQAAEFARWKQLIDLRKIAAD